MLIYKLFLKIFFYIIYIMIQSTLGRTPRHETYKQYPQGLRPLIYNMSTLVDKGEWNEDNKEMYIRMFTDKLRE